MYVYTILVDGLFVSNVVGSKAFAAVNLILPVVMILGTIGFMIGTGGGAFVSMLIGEGDSKKANEAFSMLIYLLIILGVALTVLGLIFIEPVSRALGAEGKVLEYTVVYGRILILGLVPFMLQNSFQSFLIVAEKPNMVFVISLVAGIVNMVLDFLLIYAFKIGVAGAAIATVTSQIIGGIIPIIYFARKNNSTLKLTKARLDFSIIAQSCINGSSEMFTSVSRSVINMLYNMQLLKFIGTDGVVAYGVIMYISFIFNGIYMEYSVGTTPIVGYHYGAGNKDELKSLLKKSFIFILTAALVLTGLAELLAGTLAKTFVSYNPELLNLTTRAIRIFALSYIISGFNIFTSAFFTGLGNGIVSGIISFFRTFVFHIIMIYLLPSILGVDGIWLAVIFAEVLALCVSFTYILKNRIKYGYI